MASKVPHTLKQFRQTFTLPKSNVNWFPGHMAKGIKQMQQKLKSVDCIIEVHDARIPFSGRNPNFYHMLTAIRPHILLLNKMDLANLRYKTQIEKMLTEKWNDTNIVFTDCRNDKDFGVSGLVSKAIELIKLSNRFNRAENLSYTIMVIGVPNVGKSSIINALRTKYLHKGNATRVGASPGVTRSVLEKIRICDDPLLYLLDTPGVLQPNIADIETGMKLALCSVVNDHEVGVTLVADYLLYWMNKHQNFNYLDYLQLKEPTDDINEVLLHIAVTSNMTKVIRTSGGERKLYPNFDGAAAHLIRGFQRGKMGKFMLDSDQLK